VRTSGLGYPDPYEGKEYKVEVPGLRTVEQVWGEVNGPYQTAKICQTNTTLESGETSGRILRYDRDASDNLHPGQVLVTLPQQAQKEEVYQDGATTYSATW